MAHIRHPLQHELDALEKVEAVHRIEEAFRQARMNDPEALVICGRILQRVGHRLTVSRLSYKAAA